MTNQIFFSIKNHYFHTDITLDLKKLENWFKIVDELGIHVDHFTVVTKSKYRQSFRNKISHYINDPNIPWSYHLFFLYNHPTFQMYDNIPKKITNNRNFSIIYKREFIRGIKLRESIFINTNENNDLQETVLKATSYVIPRHLWTDKDL